MKIQDTKEIILTPIELVKILSDYLVKQGVIKESNSITAFPMIRDATIHSELFAGIKIVTNVSHSLTIN